MCFVALLGTKTSSGQITAPLAMLLVSLILPVQVVPPTVFPMECNLSHGLQKFRGTSITIPVPGPSAPGHRV